MVARTMRGATSADVVEERNAQRVTRVCTVAHYVKPIAELQSVTCHMDHSVACHPDTGERVQP